MPFSSLHRPTASRRGGFTLIETAVAAVLITLFLSSLFLLNSLVLRMLRSGNETATASLLLQARAEQIRMSYWLALTNQNYIPATLLAQQPLTAINLASLTETVSVGPYVFYTGPANTAPPPQPDPAWTYQRLPDGTVSQTGGTNVPLTGIDCVQFVITEQWTGWGGRPHTRTLTTLASTWGIGQQ